MQYTSQYLCSSPIFKTNLFFIFLNYFQNLCDNFLKNRNVIKWDTIHTKKRLQTVLHFYTNHTYCYKQWLLRVTYKWLYNPIRLLLIWLKRIVREDSNKITLITYLVYMIVESWNKLFDAANMVTREKTLATNLQILLPAFYLHLVRISFPYHSKWKETQYNTSFG